MLADSLDPLTRLVAGSVTTSQGTVTGGERRRSDGAARRARHARAGGVRDGLLPRADQGHPARGTARISNQAVVSAAGLTPVTTDDPVTVQPGDPTTVAVTAAPRARLGIDLRGPARARARAA